MARNISTGEVLYALERVNILLKKFDTEHHALVSRGDSAEFRQAKETLREAGYEFFEHALYDDEGEYISRVLAIYPKKFEERG